MLCAEDILPDVEIAEDADVSRATLAKWKTHPEFQARVAEHVETLQAQARTEGLARLDVRLKRYRERARAFDLIIEERAADPDMQDVPGGRSGWLVRQFKSIGTGPNARQVEEYHFDAALSREMANLEKQAAQDAGQWSDKQEISGPNGSSLTVVIAERTDGPQ